MPDPPGPRAADRSAGRPFFFRAALPVPITKVIVRQSADRAFFLLFRKNTGYAGGSENHNQSYAPRNDAAGTLLTVGGHPV
jgi:hypothetical protein